MPYERNLRCSESFACDNPNEIVHFKFTRFSVESRFDYLTIDVTQVIDPPGYNDFYAYEDYAYDFNENFLGSLFLSGNQETDIWVKAGSKQEIQILFFRRGFENV